ncbi:MFS transporter [Adlercreutzia sp. ZJ141]|uniref:MFS transporter n=1 Tax=Adlercreutzia sp. ZJ141 TaxID=2709406 RepID=UPI0013EC3BE2|nr:MFS transporter [Adlercreutzia sp. ZJ141]
MALSVKQKIFPYLVVATGCALCLGPITLTFSCAGIFYTPVSEALGVGKGVFSLYMTFFYLAQTLALPFMGRLMERADLRIVLSVAVVLMGAPMALMSQFDSVWDFYLAGAIMGIGDAPILYLAVSTLVGRWFEKRVGFYVGICMAFTGVGGVIFNPIGGAIIASGPEGWRLGYLVFGVLTIAIALPFTLFCVRSWPSDLGMHPVWSKEWCAQAGMPQSDQSGQSDQSSQSVQADRSAQPLQSTQAARPVRSPRRGVTAKEALREPSFYAMLVFAVMVTALVSFYLFFPSYASSLGNEYPQIAALAATLAAATMAGQAIGKVLLGIVGDKSAPAGLLLAGGCGVVSIVVLWLIPNVAPLFLAAGFLYGILYAAETVQMPIMARVIFGTREYPAIYSRISTASSLSGVVFTSAWGFLIEGVGYDVTFVTVLAMLVLLGVSGSFALLRAPKD